MGHVTCLRGIAQSAATIVLVIAALLVGAGTAAAQDDPAPNNGTEYSETYEQCVADAAAGDEPGTNLDRGVNSALRAAGADGAADLTNTINCSAEAFIADPVVRYRRRRAMPPRHSGAIQSEISSNLSSKEMRSRSR